MSAPVFIGDEVSAAGFRLAGVRIRNPEPQEIRRVLDWAVKNTSLIIITVEYLSLLSAQEQNQLLVQLQPPVVVIPDIRQVTAVKDLAYELRKQLGVLE